MSGPSGKLGGLSTSVVAIIAVGGVAGLLALIVVTSLILDIPKRMKQKKNTGLMAPEEMEKKSVEIDDAEKGAIKQTTREISVQSPSLYSSTYIARPASPECQCAHPSIVVHPSPVYSNTTTLR